MSRRSAQTASREALECAEASMMWWLMGEWSPPRRGSSSSARTIHSAHASCAAAAT
jgi:hypothetical protein